MKCYHCDKEWPEANGPAGRDNTVPMSDTREPFVCPVCREDDILTIRMPMAHHSNTASLHITKEAWDAAMVP